MFLKNKIAYGNGKTIYAGDSVDVSCFDSNVGQSETHVLLTHCLDFVSVCKCLIDCFV